MHDEGADDAVARWADPRLGIMGAGEHAPADVAARLRAWVAEGAALVRPLSPDAAIRRMVPTRHVALVKRLALRRLAASRPGPDVDLDDMIGSGSLGLIRAAELFDPALGFRFSTYGGWWIRQAIGLHLREQRHAIRVPVYAQDLVAKVRLDPTLRGRLTAGQKAAVYHAMAAMRRGVLRDGDGLDEVGSMLGSVAGREADEVAVADPGVIGLLLAALPSDRDRDVFADYFGLGGREPASARRLTARYGVSAERIRQVLESGRKAMLREADRLGLAFDDCLLAPGDAPRDPASLTRPAPARDYRGVRMRPNGRWAGTVAISRSCLYVGTFDNQRECRVAVDRFAREKFGIEDYTGSAKARRGSRLGA